MQNSDQSTEKGIIKTGIEQEMQRSYLDYAMSVIVSRALPDCRDGLKPVHRRILFAMHDTHNYYNKPYRKSARVVGEVIGKYHPHGDLALYGAVVRMAQDFSLRATLIDGQGNFGSIDGDAPAHMRYTEVRLRKLSEFGLLADLDKDTVNFQDNYDNSEIEPAVLPARFPNILVNGSSGIAVGMATNIPTHNMCEVIDACCAFIKNENITAEELVNYVPAPDFPGGGEILGRSSARNAMITGRGGIMVRGKAEIEGLESKNKNIIITELPYQVNKAELVKNIEILARNKEIDGVSEIRDESNKLGMRIVIDVKRDTEPEILLNHLYKNTQLQTSFGVNMLALKNGQPILMNLLEFIKAFVSFRKEVVIRRTRFLLNKAKDKAHILMGLLIAVYNIDEVIGIIRSAKDVTEAKEALLNKKWSVYEAKIFVDLINSIEKSQKQRLEINKEGNNNSSDEIDNNFTEINADAREYKFSEPQVKAILEMKLQKLTNLEHQKIVEDLEKISEEIKSYIKILGSSKVLFELITQELLEIKENFGTPRRTKIIDSLPNTTDEDLIQQEDMVVTITRSGYIKRTSLASYKGQKRGGKGRSSMNVHEDDVITDVLVTNTHDSILFFTNLGRVYRKKVYKLPQGSMQSKGRAIVNLLPFTQDEVISNVITLSDDEYANPHGTQLIRENSSIDDDYQDNSHSTTQQIDNAEFYKKELEREVIQNENEQNEINKEKIADISDIAEEENSKQQNQNTYLVFSTAKGKVRRNALSDFANIPISGKIAIKLSEDDSLVGVVLCSGNEHILLATAQGKAVRFPVKDLRVFKGRSSEGIRGVKLSLKNDYVVSISVLEGFKIEPEVKEQFMRIDVKKRLQIAKLLIDVQTAAKEKTILESKYAHSKDYNSNNNKIQNPESTDSIDEKIKAEYEKNHAKASKIAEKEVQKLKEFYTKTTANTKQISAVPFITIQDILYLAKKEQFILTVNSEGFGKRTSAYEYRTVGRGGQGIINMNLQQQTLPSNEHSANNTNHITNPGSKKNKNHSTDKNSHKTKCVVSSFPVGNQDEIIALTNSGVVIRTAVDQIRITGRGAMGVRIINLRGNTSNNRINNKVDAAHNSKNTNTSTENDKVISVNKVIWSEDEDEDS